MVRDDDGGRRLTNVAAALAEGATLVTKDARLHALAGLVSLW